MATREMIDQTKIFTEALTAIVPHGEITVDQLNRQLEDGRAYVEAQGADNIAEVLLVALAALDNAIQRVTSLSQRPTGSQTAGFNSLSTHRPAAADLRLRKSDSAHSTIQLIRQ